MLYQFYQEVVVIHCKYEVLVNHIVRRKLE